MTNLASIFDTSHSPHCGLEMGSHDANCKLDLFWLRHFAHPSLILDGSNIWNLALIWILRRCNFKTKQRI